MNKMNKTRKKELALSFVEQLFGKFPTLLNRDSPQTNSEDVMAWILEYAPEYDMRKVTEGTSRKLKSGIEY